MTSKNLRSNKSRSEIVGFTNLQLTIDRNTSLKWGKTKYLFSNYRDRANSEIAKNSDSLRITFDISHNSLVLVVRFAGKNH